MKKRKYMVQAGCTEKMIGKRKETLERICDKVEQNGWEKKDSSFTSESAKGVGKKYRRNVENTLCRVGKLQILIQAFSMNCTRQRINVTAGNSLDKSNEYVECTKFR